ncbi:MAG: hypothetical protein U0944_01130, partial [Candidatus Moranbacteria bacterium]|nr:hypothetical protein [Candidatus Moranbacteria bacterium]
MEEEAKVEKTETDGISARETRLRAIRNKCQKIVCEKKRPIIAGLVVVLVIAIGVGAYFYKFRTADIGLEGAKSKVADFVNGNLLQAGTTATIEDASVENGLYKITINIAGKQKVVTYLSKDGKKFFPEAMDTDVEKKEVAEKQPEEVKEIPKSDKPVVDLYVMSFCPFGNKAEDTLKSAYDLLKKKVDFNFHYIVSSNGEEILSLHGPKEVAQNKREACVLKNYGKDKWFAFVEYVNK